MKRLNSYLLTHHPLLWNLRVHYIWPVIVVLHLLFFFWGFSNASLTGSWHYRSFGLEGEIVTLAVLLGTLLLVFWLAMYFRNNAFKSFLPLRRGRLALETLLVFATSFGIAGIAESYRAGGSMRIIQEGRGVDTEAEQQTVSLARHFLPFGLEGFSRFNECNGADGRVSMDDSARIATDTFSYLNYCEPITQVDDQGNVQYLIGENTVRARRWLRNGNRDSIEQVLRQYLALVRKYGGSYVFNPKAHVASMFSSPGFQLRYTIHQYAMQGNSNAVVDAEGNLDAETTISTVDAASGKQAPELLYGDKYAYIEIDRPQQSLSLVERARLGAFRFEVMVTLLYIALALTILIMGFRLTELRTWGIAAIGAGLWAIIVGLLIAITGAGQGSLVLVLLLEALFTAAAFALINGSGQRRLAGLCYLWSLATMPFVLPNAWILLRQVVEPIGYGYDGSSRGSSAALNDFLREYQDWIISGNIVFSMALILVLYIPLARKWQAMPEE